jgi:hypothetical protein
METDLQSAILSTLSYFQVFQYPLKREEIWNFLGVKCEAGECYDALAELVSLSVVCLIDGFYCLDNDPAAVIARKEGNRRSRAALQKARRIARFLGMFPFVEAVCISGSLSKDFALPDSDLDYFIITAPGRLWTARNLMHFFRKLTFVANAQNQFCMNYYISAQYPEIFPKNLYTAIELATLKPTAVNRGLKELVERNEEWVSAYLPNMDLSEKKNMIQPPKPAVTRALEWLINKLGGDELEATFYTTTMGRWARKWSKKGYPLGKCLPSAGAHFNTPLNYPKNLPENILSKHDAIYRQADNTYMEALRTAVPTTVAAAHLERYSMLEEIVF